MKSQSPFLVLEQPYLLTEEKNSFCVHYYQMDSRYFLALDIFSLRDSRFLERHLARFQCYPQSGEKGSLNFSLQENPSAIIIDEQIASECAVYDDAGSCPLVIRAAVLRKDDSALQFEDYLRIYRTRTELEQDQKYFEQWIATYPVLDSQPKEVKDKMPTVCLISASFRDFDAVGNFIWDGWSLLKRNGFPVEIYSQYCDLHFRPFTRNIRELFTMPADELAKRSLFYTYSIYDENLPDIADLPCKKVAYYHGITDPAQLGDVDEHVKKMCEAGLKDLSRMSAFDGLFANSQSSLREFRQYYHSITQCVNFDNASTLPPLVAMQSKWAAVETDTSLLPENFSTSKILLYVGRMFPHKHVEDVIAVFAEYNKKDPSALLLLVGGQHPVYYSRLRAEIEKLSVDCQRQIRFYSTLTQGQLKAVYQATSVFITMTEHEGFCIPVLEAMMFGIPVVAKHRAAIPEVMKGNGILIDVFDVGAIANRIYEVCYDMKYRDRIVSGQFLRVKDFSDLSLAKSYLAAMERLLKDE